MMMDHILGTLYGMALGDAMGMPSELLSRRRIQEIFGRITTFEDSPEENPAAIDMTKGQFTDDTVQAPSSWTRSWKMILCRTSRSLPRT